MINAADKRGHMKITLTVLCLVACSSSAFAQYGVSNARDGNGNLIRDSGMNSGRTYDRAPVNNLNAPARPAQRTAPNTGISNTGITNNSRQ
jgi:hypothetical protein